MDRATSETSEADARKRLRQAKLLVVKVGSKSIHADADYFKRIAKDLATLHAEKRKVVLVTSGAIALGVTKLGYPKRPSDLGALQACAAAGQSLLMKRYEEAFDKQGVPVAQVLLTHADVADRTRANNARNALTTLLARGAIPILNENDCVAVEEIKFGDNDQLAALTTALISAEALMLLSDIPGLQDSAGELVPFLGNVREARPFLRSGKSDVGTGGMESKLLAAERATFAGADVVIASARTAGTLGDILRGERVGTVLGRARKLSSKKHWIAFTLKPQGVIYVDGGCEAALRGAGKSILAVGIHSVAGTFEEGDSVEIAGPSGKVFARGLTQVGTAEAASICIQPKRKLQIAKADTTGAQNARVIVHRNDLVVF
jgi:glutamate 5-kinase